MDGVPSGRQVQVYAGTAGHSAWFSEDLGETWLHPNSHSGMYLEARVWNFASHPRAPERLFAGTDMGLFRWDEVSARWTPLPSPMEDVWALAVDPADPDVILAGTRPASFWRSTDAGATWTKLDAPGLSQFSEVNMGPTRVTQILFDPVVADTVWATVEIGSIYRSTDRGLTWERKDAGLVSADLHGVCVIATGGGQRALLATTNRGLHRSEDGGESWVLQELPSPWPYTRGVTVRADDPSIVFLANGNGPPGNDGKLLRSRDHGRTWEDVGLPGELNSSVWAVATDAADPMLLFTYTNLGQVFRSTDGGESWVRLPHEFGELRAMTWRALPTGIRKAEHSVTRRAVKARELAAAS
ncbi:WD40/YVTN/BNR-like repeat-containing protein [Muricoccus radiodurans]|uniref:WD40/YVTN/BNR-like repeat-containing protein n=1 Tax=Muricoccus radiodurans TaxID=2231721 RepID=UPI003CEBB7E4